MYLRHQILYFAHKMPFKNSTHISSLGDGFKHIRWLGYGFKHIRSLDDGFKYPTNHIIEHYLVISTRIPSYRKSISIISYDFAGSCGDRGDYRNWVLKGIVSLVLRAKKVPNQTTSQSDYLSGNVITFHILTK